MLFQNRKKDIKNIRLTIYKFIKKGNNMMPFKIKKIVYISIMLINILYQPVIYSQPRTTDPQSNYSLIQQELKNAPQKLFNFEHKKIQPADDVSFFNEKFNAWREVLKKIDTYIKEQLSVSRPLVTRISQSNKTIFEEAQKDINESTESLYQGIINKPGEGGKKASLGRAAALMTDLLPAIKPIQDRLLSIQNDGPDTVKIKELLLSAATVLKNASLLCIKKANEQRKNG